MAEKKKGNRKLVWVISVLAVMVIAGSWLADRALKGRDHPGLRTFVSQWYRNYPKSFNVEPKVLSITVGQRELDRLQSVVEAARERGVIIPEGNEYVEAELKTGDKTFKARIRIKGKMTDHVKGDKWSFRVIAKKDGGFLGMKRFSLQHPGTRNYLYEWLHQQLMKGEGIVALRYGFIRLEFNGEDRGVYAYEEHFGPELLENNSRVEGPLFRFDPGLFWEHRLNAMNGLRFNEPFAAYQAAAIDAFGTSDLQKDPKQLRYFEEAIALMTEFRHARVSASEVFDAEKVAKRLALLDILGGHRSLDWSDSKFYFDPVLERIEPVAYESFSAFPIRDIAGAGQWQGANQSWQDIYTAWFNDPVIFRSYIHHLERYSRPEYLDSTLNVLGPRMDTAAATIYAEFPYKVLDRTIYEKNQKVIRALLDVPKGFHAYDEGVLRDTLSITAIPIGSLPIEVHGLLLSDKKIRPTAGSNIVPIRPQFGPGDPFMLRFHIPDTTLLDKKAVLLYSVLGSSVQKELEVFPYSYLDGIKRVGRTAADHQPLSTFPFIQVDALAKTITFRTGSCTIGQDLVIPTGYSVIGNAPLRIDLQKGARIISSSPILLNGREEAEIVITSSDKSGGGILIENTTGPNKWRHVRVEGFGDGGLGNSASIVLQMAQIIMENCTLAEVRTRDLLLCVRSIISISDCSLLGGSDQLTSAFSQIRVANCSFGGAADDAIVVRGGSFRASNSGLTGVSGTGIKLNTLADVQLEGVQINAKGKGVELSKAANLKMNNGSITSGSIGVDVKQAEVRYGASTADLTKVTLSAKEQETQIGEGGLLKIDGRFVDPGINKELR